MRECSNVEIGLLNVKKELVFAVTFQLSFIETRVCTLYADYG